MKFSIHIDNVKRRAAYSDYYNYLNKKKLKNAYINIALGAVFILLGLFLLNYVITQTGLVVTGLILLVIFIIEIINVHSDKKRFLEAVDRQYKLHTEEDVLEYTLELDEDYFKMDHVLNSSKIAWKVFYSYQIIESNLILYTAKEFGVFYLFCKEEFSNDDFEKTISFIKTKVKSFTI